MGTRNLTAVMINGEYKIAQYGQWDGYPSGQGSTVLQFLSNQENIKNLKDAFSRTRFIDEEGRDKEFIEAYSANAPEWSNEPDNRTEEQIAWFRNYISRDLGADILYNVASSEDEEILLSDSLNFAGDSLFCEWAYVIDFDKNVLEVYRGFNDEPIKEGRFISGDPIFEVPEGGYKNDYEPIILLKTYELNNLPSVENFVEELEALAYPEEEDEVA